MKSNSFLNSVFVMSLRHNTPAGKSQLYRNTDQGQIQTDFDLFLIETLKIDHSQRLMIAS